MATDCTDSGNSIPIQSVQQTEQGVHVQWSDSTSSFFHSIWLRDNCRCESCGDASVGRRNLKLTKLSLNVHAERMDISNTNSLRIDWNDAHQSSYSSTWLRQNAYDDQARASRAFQPTLWTPALRNEFPWFGFDAVMRNDEQFHQLITQVRDLGLALVSDATSEPGTAEQLALKIGPPQESNFGRVQDLVIDYTKPSVANRGVALKPHTDEPYRASPPGILVFHCLQTDGTGAGSSFFLDGFEIAETLRAEDPQGFDLLSAENHSYRRHFQDDVDLITQAPTLSVDEFGQLTGIRINDRVAAPLSINPRHVPVYYRAMKRLLELAEDPERLLMLTLKPGDIAVFDNHRILHGRTELNIKGKRWLQWIQVNRGDFYSTLRIHAERLSKDRTAQPLLRGAY